MADGLLSLSWNNHSSTFCHMLSTLRDMERYTDVTVSCDGKFYPAHKLVLSTCSDYFLKMFEKTPCKHPIIVVKGVASRDIEALLSYMYAGVVSVAQNDLAQLIHAAELLEIKGLAVPDEPPVIGRKAGHSSGSAEDRTSPPPKRQRREGTKSPSQHETQTYCSTAPSPHCSPFRRDTEPVREETAANKYRSRPEQVPEPTSEKGGARTTGEQPQPQEQQTSHSVEQQIECATPIKESPQALAEVMEEQVFKEEIIETDIEDQVPEAEFDYGSLVPDHGPCSSRETKESLDSFSSSFSHPGGDQPFESHAGPSGLQGWPGLIDDGDTTSQGYTGDLNQELPSSGQPATQPQHLVSVATTFSIKEVVVMSRNHSPRAVIPCSFW